MAIFNSYVSLPSDPCDAYRSIKIPTKKKKLQSSDSSPIGPIWLDMFNGLKWKS